MNEPIHITDDQFEQTVLKSLVPVIVDFWAPWCGPCRQIAPALEKIAKDYDGKVLVAKVNTDENPQWAGQFEVSGIPTLLFVADGKLVHTQVGAVPHGYLRQIVDKFLEVVRPPVVPEIEERAPQAAEQPVPETPTQPVSQ